MLSSALFSNNSVRGTSKNLVELKAGKMTMKGKMVFPDKRKGQLYVYQSDDSLMHFCWKDRTTGTIEDDLIIFPDDCEFKHVKQCNTGRVYLLRFKSSSRKFFFWLQDVKTDKDEEQCRKINELLNNPPAVTSQRNSGSNPEGDLQNLLNNMSQQQLIQLFGGVGQISGLGSLLGTINRPLSGNRVPTTSSSNSVTTAATGPPFPSNSAVADSETSKSIGKSQAHYVRQVEATLSSSSDNHPIQLTDLQNILTGVPELPSSTETAIQRAVVNELSLTIPSAICANERLNSTVDIYLPAEDSLSTTLSSPQFLQALSMFWFALQSGQVAPIIQQFGLGCRTVAAASSGNIDHFISALEAEEKSQSNDSEKTDDTDVEKDSQNETRGKQTKVKQKLNEDSGNGKNNDDNNDEGMALD